MARRSRSSASSRGGGERPFRSWTALNDYLRSATDEGALRRHLSAELGRDAPRVKFVLRIHSRLNVVRYGLERADLQRQLGERA